jgi:hypothetical protein
MDEGGMYEMLMNLVEPRGPTLLECHRLLADELQRQPHGKAGYARAVVRVAEQVDPSGDAPLVLRVFLSQYLGEDES